jgi:hypothetical protein
VDQRNSLFICKCKLGFTVKPEDKSERMVVVQVQGPSSRSFSYGLKAPPRAVLKLEGETCILTYKSESKFLGINVT